MSFDFNDFFTLGKEIGRGAYGTVFIATIKKPYPPLQAGSLVAIKSISTSRITSIQEKEKLETEISLMSKLDHPNIVKLYGVEKTSSHYFLILEYCNGGDLFQYMKTFKKASKEKTTSYISSTTNYEIINYSNIFSSEESIRDFASQIASGLFYLHSHQIVHRDLKPHNILISRTKTPQSNSNKHQSNTSNDSSEKITLKIADFGFARFLKPSDLATTVCGSPVYMAPEIQFGSQYSSNVDMWSLGIILYELITGQTPFPRVKTQYELAMELKNKGSKFYSLPSSVKASPELRNLIEKLLTINPNNRMTFSEFMNDPFINISKSSKNSNNGKTKSNKNETNNVNGKAKNQPKSDDVITIDEDFDFEIISESSFALVPEKAKPQNQNQNKTKPPNQNQNKIQNQLKIHSAETFSNELSTDTDLTSLSTQSENTSFLELSESFKEKQKFSFMSSFPDVGSDQAVEYLTEAYTSADTIISHFTECQNISNNLLINTEMLIIRFLIDFLVEEKHLTQLASKSSENNFGSSVKYRSSSKREKEKKSYSSIEKDVCDLIKVCINELSAIMTDSDDLSYEETESESESDLISLNPHVKPNVENDFSGAKSTIVTDINKKENLSKGSNFNSSSNLVDKNINDNRKIHINLSGIVDFGPDIKKTTPKNSCESGMQFLFNKAVEYAKAAAKLEMCKQFEFAALKYQRALYLLQPIAFSKNVDDQIKAARDLYKKIDERRIDAAYKSSK